jgi:hypothetical protein
MAREKRRTISLNLAALANPKTGSHFLFMQVLLTHAKMVTICQRFGLKSLQGSVFLETVLHSRRGQICENKAAG